MYERDLSFEGSCYIWQSRRSTTLFFSCFYAHTVLRKGFHCVHTNLISNQHVFPALNQSSFAYSVIQAFYSLHFSYTGCFWLIKFCSCVCKKTNTRMYYTLHFHLRIASCMHYIYRYGCNYCSFPSSYNANWASCAIQACACTIVHQQIFRDKNLLTEL